MKEDADSGQSMALQLLAILEKLGISSYFARSKREKEIFNGLLNRGLVELRPGTKACFKLTVDTFQNINRPLPVNMVSQDTSNALLLKDTRYQIRAMLNRLISPMKPLAKIPDLWSLAANHESLDLSWNRFQDVLLRMHCDGEITLQGGLSAHESSGGIQSENGKQYFYVMIE